MVQELFSLGLEYPWPALLGASQYLVGLRRPGSDDVFSYLDLQRIVDLISQGRDLVMLMMESDGM